MTTPMVHSGSPLPSEGVESSVNRTIGKEAEASGNECAEGSKGCCHLNQQFSSGES